VTAATLPSLPSVDDCSWVSPFGGGDKDLARLRRYIVAERPVWWRRESFAKPFRDVEPKMHIFAGRTRSEDPDDRWTFTWKALCGFTYDRTEIIFGANPFVVTTPAKDTRCLRCAAELKKISRSTK
jgi:hypothetical protein